MAFFYTLYFFLFTGLLLVTVDGLVGWMYIGVFSVSVISNIQIMKLSRSPLITSALQLSEGEGVCSVID